jgi:hypothetical protein
LARPFRAVWEAGQHCPPLRPFGAGHDHDKGLDQSNGNRDPERDNVQRDRITLFLTYIMIFREAGRFRKIMRVPAQSFRLMQALSS